MLSNRIMYEKELLHNSRDTTSETSCVFPLSGVPLFRSIGENASVFYTQLGP